MKQQLQLAIFAILLFTSTTFAYVNNRPANQKIINCPEKITCIASGKDILCSKIGEDLQYWAGEKYWIASGGIIPVAVGDYIFNGASAPYHAQGIKSVSCTYTFHGSNPLPIPNMNLGFNPSLGGNFEAYYDKSGKWDITGVNANCTSNTTSSCPIVEKNSLVIGEIAPDEGSTYGFVRASLTIAANGMSFVHDKSNTDGYFEITYDNALKICGSVTQCTFFIKEKDDLRYDDYDSVTVDMTNNMKILQITSKPRGLLHSDGRHTYQLRQHEFFNMARFTLIK